MQLKVCNGRTCHKIAFKTKMSDGKKPVKYHKTPLIFFPTLHECLTKTLHPEKTKVWHVTCIYLHVLNKSFTQWYFLCFCWHTRGTINKYYRPQCQTWVFLGQQFDTLCCRRQGRQMGGVKKELTETNCYKNHAQWHDILYPEHVLQ